MMEGFVLNFVFVVVNILGIDLGLVKLVLMDKKLFLFFWLVLFLEMMVILYLFCVKCWVVRVLMWVLLFNRRSKGWGVDMVVFCMLVEIFIMRFDMRL